MPTRLRHPLRLPHPVHPAVLLCGVAVLALLVTTSATVVHLDAALGRLARGAAAGTGDLGFAISTLAATDVVLPLTAAAAVVLLLLRQWRGALTVVLAVLTTQAVVELIKLVVERPRPAANGAIAEASGFSFPSAHSATGMALYASLAFLAARGTRGPLRTAVLVAAGGVIVSIGASRVLLAAHYPIDVFAGWLTGGALVFASWLVARRLTTLRPFPQPA